MKLSNAECWLENENLLDDLLKRRIIFLYDADSDFIGNYHSNCGADHEFEK